MTTSIPPLTTHESLRFDNGDHVVVHSSPRGVQVTGYLAGAWVEESWDTRTAAEQARLLITDAPDAMWHLPADRAHRLATAIDGAAVPVAFTPYSDTPEDAYGERVDLDGGHADVDVPGDHVEVTVTIGGRATIGLALSPTEADRIGQALRAAAARADTAHVDARLLDLEAAAR